MEDRTWQQKEDDLRATRDQINASSKFVLPFFAVLIRLGFALLPFLATGIICSKLAGIYFPGHGKLHVVSFIVPVVALFLTIETIKYFHFRFRESGNRLWILFFMANVFVICFFPFYCGASIVLNGGLKAHHFDFTFFAALIVGLLFSLPCYLMLMRVVWPQRLGAFIKKTFFGKKQSENGPEIENSGKPGS
jgi:hypothetical protein